MGFVPSVILDLVTLPLYARSPGTRDEKIHRERSVPASPLSEMALCWIFGFRCFLLPSAHDSAVFPVYPSASVRNTEKTVGKRARKPARSRAAISKLFQIEPRERGALLSLDTGPVMLEALDILGTAELRSLQEPRYLRAVSGPISRCLTPNMEQSATLF